MAFTIYLLTIAVGLVLSSPYHFVLGTSNGVNGTSTYNFGYDTRDHPGGGGSGQTDSGPRLMREETRLPDGTVIGRYGYTDPFGVFRQVKYVAGSTGYYAYEDVTGGSGGSTSLPLFFKATARQRDLGLNTGIDLSAKFNPPLYHPEAHLAETTPSTPPPPPLTLSPWEGSFGPTTAFKKILSPQKSPEESPLSRLHHQHQHQHLQHLHHNSPHYHHEHQPFPSTSNNQLSTSSSSSSSSSSSPPFTLSSSSSNRQQSRLTHSLSSVSSTASLSSSNNNNNNQGHKNDRLTLNRDKGLFTTLSAPSSTSSSGSVIKTTASDVGGQLRYNRQNSPKTAFQFDYDQASLIERKIQTGSSTPNSYGNYKQQSNLTPIKSNSNSAEDDLKELESFRIPSGLNIYPSSLSRLRSSPTVLSSRSSTQYNKISLSQSSPQPAPKVPLTPTPPTNEKTTSTYPSSTVSTTTTTTTTEASLSHLIFNRNQVIGENSTLLENERPRRSDELSSTSFNSLKNETYLSSISISREPVLEESIGNDDLGETESVRVTSSSSSSSSVSSSNIEPSDGLGSSGSDSSLAPLPINLSDISARYRVATIPEVEILSTYGTRLNNPIDGQPESLGYYDSRLLRGLNYDDLSLEPHPVYTPVIDSVLLPNTTATTTSKTTTTSTIASSLSALEPSDGQNETNDKPLIDQSTNSDLTNPLTESISVAISSTQSAGNQGEDVEKSDELPIESILNLPDQSLSITFKPETTTTTATPSTTTITMKPEESVAFNQSNNSYSLLTDQSLKVVDRNVEVTPNLTLKQVINNRLINGLTRVSQSVTLSLRTEGETSTSTLPSTTTATIDKSTDSGLTEAVKTDDEIKTLPEIITDQPTTLPTPTQETILSSTSPSSSISTISSSIGGFNDATTINSDLGPITDDDEVTSPLSTFPMVSVTEVDSSNQPIPSSTIKTIVEDPFTTTTITAGSSPSLIDEKLSVRTTTEASLLSVELTSKSIQSNWSPSINNDVPTSPLPLSISSLPSQASTTSLPISLPSKIDYIESDDTSEFKKLPNEPVNNGINHLPSTNNKDKDEWLERILTKENSSQDEPHRIETRLEIPDDSSKPMKKIVKIWYKRGRLFFSNPSNTNIKQNFSTLNQGPEKLPRTKIIRIPRGHRPERMGYRKGVFLNKIPITSTPTPTTTTTTTITTTFPTTTTATIPTTVTMGSTIDDLKLVSSSSAPTTEESTTTTITPVSTSTDKEATTWFSTMLTDKALSESPTRPTSTTPSEPLATTSQPTTTMITSTTPSLSSTTTTTSASTITLAAETELPEITSTQQSTTKTNVDQQSTTSPSTTTVSSESTTLSPPTESTIMTVEEITKTPEGLSSTFPSLSSSSTSSPSTTFAPTSEVLLASTTSPSPNNNNNKPVKPSALYVPPIASLLRSLVSHQALISSGIGFNSPSGPTLSSLSTRKNGLSSNLYIPPLIPTIKSEIGLESSPLTSDENKVYYNKPYHNSPITRSIGEQSYHLPLTYFH